jgi:hypothetical protein
MNIFVFPGNDCCFPVFNGKRYKAIAADPLHSADVKPYPFGYFVASD